MTFIEIKGLDKLVNGIFCPSCGRKCDAVKENVSTYDVKCEGRDVSITTDIICARCGHIFCARLSYSLKDITPFELP